MIATASHPIGLGGNPQTAQYRVAGPEAARTAGRGEGLDISRPTLPWRWSTALTDSVALLAVVWSIPLAVLLVGAPIALAITLVLWLGRFALSAF